MSSSSSESDKKPKTWKKGAGFYKEDSSDSEKEIKPKAKWGWK